MSKKVPVVKITTPDAAGELTGLRVEATVAMADVAAAMREGLLAFSAAAGLVVMQQMLTEELAGIVGPKHAKLGAKRVGNWHGTTTGQVVLGSQKVTVPRPRGRLVDGGDRAKSASPSSPSRWLRTQPAASTVEGTVTVISSSSR